MWKTQDINIVSVHVPDMIKCATVITSLKPCPVVPVDSPGIATMQRYMGKVRVLQK